MLNNMRIGVERYFVLCDYKFYAYRKLLSILEKIFSEGAMNIVQRARYINLLIQKRENHILVLITEVKSEFPKIKK